MSGTPIGKHLERVEDDQSVSGIDRLIATVRSGIGRKWFSSQELKPTIPTMKYNSITGRYEYRNGNQLVIANGGSAATDVLTCPAGRRYIVRFISSSNDTTDTRYNMAGVIGGTAIDFLITGDATDGTRIAILVGAPFYVPVLGMATLETAILNPIVLDAGDTLTITQVDYVALDGTVYNYIIEEIVAI